MEPILGGGLDAADLIKDTTTATFMVDVIEASKTTPVIIDFWAPWCEPCKQLGPVIEKVVTENAGAVKLVKINIDENQEIAQQMRVQSIPAVFAFAGGQPVDGFAGALPESQIKQFVERVLRASKDKTGPSPIDEALEQAAQAEETGDTDQAGAIYSEILKHQPENIPAIAGLARNLHAKGETDAARALLDGLPDKAKQDPEIKSVLASLDLAEKIGDSQVDLEPLRAQLAADENNHQARFDLALALYAANEAEAAIDELLTLFSRNRGWNDDAARKQLVEIFDALGAESELVSDSRRRLSSLMFA
ncbi:MAG: putative thioredoxin [Alphaproteobacteria bacterium]|jgi:putative thioredoxin